MLKDLLVGVIGGGVVGQATARSLLEYVREVRVYDTVKERRTHRLADIAVCNPIFLCLPTPQRQDSLECDTSILEGMLGYFRDKSITSDLVIKSTVPVGFTRQMAERYRLTNLVHSPEFLTARCADADAAMPSRLVIGHCQPQGISPAGRRLTTIYQARWPNVPVLTMRSEDSEALKLFTNSFFAVKVAYFNEINNYAATIGLDWEAIVGAMRLDRHINPAHTQVPGHDGFGYSGACLPKDLTNLIHCMQEAGRKPYVTEAAHTRNVEVDRQRNVLDRKRGSND